MKDVPEIQRKKERVYKLQQQQQQEWMIKMRIRMGINGWDVGMTNNLILENAELIASQFSFVFVYRCREFDRKYN